MEGTNMQKAVKTECSVWSTLWILTLSTSRFEGMSFLLGKPLQMWKITNSWSYFQEIRLLNSCNSHVNSCCVSVWQNSNIIYINYEMNNRSIYFNISFYFQFIAWNKVYANSNLIWIEANFTLNNENIFKLY